MYASGLLSVFLAAGAAANGIQERAAVDSAAFSTAITALVGSYLPSSVLSQLAPRITSAAAAAGTTGDATNLLYQALEAPTPPAWLNSAIPTEIGSNFAALTSQIASLRPTAGGTAATAPLPTSTLIVATTTNSAGSTITTSFTSVLPTGTGTGTASGHGSSSSSGSGSSSASGSGTGTSSGTATSSSKSGNAAAPTGAVHQAVGGVVALVGLAVAL